MLTILLKAVNKVWFSEGDINVPIIRVRKWVLKKEQGLASGKMCISTFINNMFRHRRRSITSSEEATELKIAESFPKGNMEI